METKGTLGVNKQQLINLLGSKMYRSDVQNVAVKELIQNAFDACKIAQALGLISKPRIGVETDYYHRTVTVSDNGIGMTPEIVQKAFFTIGGSDKGGVDNRLRSGGLGLAKMAFLFSSKRISLTTVRDGIMTSVNTTPEEIQSDNFIIKTDYTSAPNGTTVQVVIPNDYVDENGESHYISFSEKPSFLNYPLIWDGLELFVNGRPVFVGRVPEGYAQLGVAKSAFGDIEIFVKPRNASWKSSYIEAEVYISGLRQFRKSFYQNDSKANIEAILNILPSVDTSSRVYPINNTREGFNAVVNPEVEDLKWLMLKINSLMAKRRARDMFANKIASSAKSVSDVSVQYDADLAFNQAIEQVQSAFTKEVTPSGRVENVISIEAIHTQREAEKRESSLDFSGIRLDAFDVAPIDTDNLDINKPLFHNNTNMIIEDDGQMVMDEIGDLMLQLKKLYMEIYQDESSKLERQFWGISFDTRYLGVHVSEKIINLLAINPFLGGKRQINVNPIEYRVEAILHEIMHEFTHNARDYHDASFCTELMYTYARFAGIGASFIAWKDRLRECVRRNISVFAKYEMLYAEAHNVSDGFDID